MRVLWVRPCLSSVGDRRAEAASPRMVKEALRMRPSRIMGLVIAGLETSADERRPCAVAGRAREAASTSRTWCASGVHTCLLTRSVCKGSLTAWRGIAVV